MKASRAVKIAGTGSYVPERIVTNQELVDRFELDTTADWISRKLGIETRRYAAADEQTSDMAVIACQRALAAAAVDVSQVGAIFLALGFGDYRYPATAPLVQRKLGANNAFAVDVSTACAGFLSCVHIGQRYVADGSMEACLVVAADVGSRSNKFDPRDRTGGVIFGDAAAAAVLVPTQDGVGLLSDYQGSDGAENELTGIRAGGSRHPVSAETIAQGLHLGHMDPHSIWRGATRALPLSVRTVCERAGVSLSSLDFVITHQANLRLIEHVMADLGLPMKKTYTTVQKYGNTGCVSVAITLAEAVEHKRIRPGDLVAVAAVGAGFNWAGSLIRWA